jgi:hypothetical protein
MPLIMYDAPCSKAAPRTGTLYLARTIAVSNGLAKLIACMARTFLSITIL